MLTIVSNAVAVALQDMVVGMLMMLNSTTQGLAEQVALQGMVTPTAVQQQQQQPMSIAAQTPARLPVGVVVALANLGKAWDLDAYAFFNPVCTYEIFIMMDKPARGNRQNNNSTKTPTHFNHKGWGLQGMCHLDECLNAGFTPCSTANALTNRLKCVLDSYLLGDPPHKHEGDICDGGCLPCIPDLPTANHSSFIPYYCMHHCQQLLGPGQVHGQNGQQQSQQQEEEEEEQEQQLQIVASFPLATKDVLSMTVLLGLFEEGWPPNRPGSCLPPMARARLKSSHKKERCQLDVLKNGYHLICVVSEEHNISKQLAAQVIEQWRHGHPADVPQAPTDGASAVPTSTGEQGAADIRVLRGIFNKCMSVNQVCEMARNYPGVQARKNPSKAAAGRVGGAHKRKRNASPEASG